MTARSLKSTEHSIPSMTFCSFPPQCQQVPLTLRYIPFQGDRNVHVSSTHFALPPQTSEPDNFALTPPHFTTQYHHIASSTNGLNVGRRRCERPPDPARDDRSRVHHPKSPSCTGFCYGKACGSKWGAGGWVHRAHGEELERFSWGESPKHQHTQVFGEDIQVHQLQSLLFCGWVCVYR